MTSAELSKDTVKQNISTPSSEGIIVPCNELCSINSCKLLVIGVVQLVLTAPVKCGAAKS